MNIYIYPPEFPHSREANFNPYIRNLMDGLSAKCNVVNRNQTANISILHLLKNSFRIDAVMFNWIENLGNRPLGLIQFLVFIVVILLLKLRRVKILWIFHNIHPHEGDRWISKLTRTIMFSFSDVIVAHSTDALEYVQRKTDRKAVFLHHPVSEFKFETEINPVQLPKYDMLIWGSIAPYKSVVEFMEFYNLTLGNFKLKIAGRCRDADYDKRIKSLILSPNIDYENRVFTFEELHSLVNLSRFVLFPYQSSSVSSSGVLMDTISLNGSVIGPNMGAFKDLHKEGISFVYNNYEEISEILKENYFMDKNKLQRFIEDNTWMSFCDRLYSLLCSN